MATPKSVVSVQIQRTLDSIGMTAAQLSEACDVPLRTVHRHLVDADSIKLDILQKYAKAMQIPTDYLLSENGANNTVWTGLSKIDSAIHSWMGGEFDPEKRSLMESLMADDYVCCSHHYIGGCTEGATSSHGENSDYPPHLLPDRLHASAIHYGISGKTELDMNYSWTRISPLDYKTQSVANVFICGDRHICVHCNLLTVTHKEITPTGSRGEFLDCNIRDGKSDKWPKYVEPSDLHRSHTKVVKRLSKICVVLITTEDIIDIVESGLPVQFKLKTWQALHAKESSNTFSMPSIPPS